jgi:hypothetical protein
MCTWHSPHGLTRGERADMLALATMEESSCHTLHTGMHFDA